MWTAKTRREAVDLVGQQLEIAAGRDCDQLESIRELTQNIERLRADRAGRPDQRDACARAVACSIGFAHRSQQSKASARNHPATKVKMQRVDSIEESAMARDQIAAVLDPGIALEHRLGKVTIETDPGDDGAEEKSPQPVRSEAEAPEADDAGDRGGDHAARRILPSTCWD